MEKTPELAALICAGLEQSGNLRATCRALGLALATVQRWVDSDAEFASQYTRAKAAGMAALADEIVAISDGRLPAVTVLPDGTEVPAVQDAQRDRLRVDTRKWLLSKVLPKVYGDKLAHEHSGPDGKPIAHQLTAAGMSDDELARIAMGEDKP